MATDVNPPGSSLFVYIIFATYIFRMFYRLFTLCRIFSLGCMYITHCSLIISIHPFFV